MIIPPDKKEREYEPPRPTAQRSVLDSPVDHSRTLPSTTAHPPSDNSTANASLAQDVLQNGAQSERTPRPRRLEEADPTEETPLIPPPSYREAVSQTGKARRSKKVRYLVIGLLVVLCVGVTAGVTVVKRRRQERSSRNWKRGGLDGKGKFDHRWQHRTPFLSNEPMPRDCDLFSEPRLIDSWRNGATARPIYGSTAEYLFPLEDGAALQNLWMNVRGSRAYGAVEIVGPGTEVTDSERPPAGQVKVSVRVTAEDVRNLNDWHFCRAGQPGREGIAIVGPNDGSRPVSSPWLEGYMKIFVDIIFPVEADVDRGGTGESRFLLESLTLNVENMGVGFGGDLRGVALGKQVSVSTTNAPLVLAQALSADNVRLETTNGNIAAQAIIARDSIILHTENAFISCLHCTANSSYIVLHNENGRISGNYRAGGSIDLVTSGQDVDGQFHSPRIWVKNQDGSIEGRFGGLVPEDENGSFVAVTTFGRVVASIDFAHLLPPPKKGPVWDHSVRSKIPIRLHTQSSDIVATITNLPPHTGIVMEAEVADGGISIIAPDQVQGKLDLTVAASAVVTIDLGDEEKRLNKRLRVDKQPHEDGRWQGPVHGTLMYRHYSPGSDIPFAMSSLGVVSAQYVNLTL